MKLILHIGTGKTGTTALQQFLCANAKKLREHGIHYATPPHEFNFNSVPNTQLLTGLDNSGLSSCERGPNGRSAHDHRKFRPSMERLRTEFTLPPFPRFNLDSARASWQPYPGLSLEMRREIEFHSNAVQRQVGFRLERLVIRASSLTQAAAISLMVSRFCARQRNTQIAAGGNKPISVNGCCLCA
ncbi:hypothetical protein ACWTU6_01980 [Mesorhizobium sp. BHbsci]